MLYIHRESVKEQLKEVNIICSRVKLTCIVLEYVSDKRRRTKLERRSFIYDTCIRSSHKFVPIFVYTFHVSIYKHTAIRDQCT